MFDGGATVNDGNGKQLKLILDNKMNVCFIFIYDNIHKLKLLAITNWLIPNM